MDLNCLFDGIVSSVFRQSKSENAGQWMVFDGPVFSDWADNLNSVLDDNRKLCLSSGEVLELTDNTSLIFEVEDLKNASPSTVNLASSFDFEKPYCGSLSVYSFLDFTSWRYLFRTKHVGLAMHGKIMDRNVQK